MQALQQPFIQQPLQEKARPLQSLTSLRFVAAFLVFVSHFYIFDYFTGLTQGSTYDLFVQSGWLGVSFFFVLSGFVLFINYCHPASQAFNLKHFYINRFARIYPIFFLTTLLALPIEILSPERRAVWGHFISNLFMVHCFYPDACGTLNQPAWSIGSEFTFYLLFPLFSLLFLPKFRPRTLFFSFLLYSVYLGLMIWLLSGNFYARASFPFNRVGEFLLGMTAGYLFLLFEKHAFMQQLEYRPQLVQGALWSAGLLFLGMLYQPVWLQAFPSAQQVFYLFYAGPAMAIILVFAFLERANRLPAVFLHPWLILGGEISYAFYLLHHLVIRYTKHMLGFVFHLSVPQSDWAVAMVVSCFIFGVSLLGAYGLYRLVEKPMRIRIIRHFASPSGFVGFLPFGYNKEYGRVP